MSQLQGFADKVGFIWGVADLLRGDFKAHEYGQVLLPLTVLRRLECALEPTKAAVVAKAGDLGDSPGLDAVLRSTSKHRFYNTSPLDLASRRVRTPQSSPTPVRQRDHAPRRLTSLQKSRTQMKIKRHSPCRRISCSSRPILMGRSSASRSFLLAAGAAAGAPP